MKTFYRISDGGYAKEKPDYITNSKCLNNFLTVFSSNCGPTHIIADNITDDTLRKIRDHIIFSDGFVTVERTSYGNGAKSFNHALDLALKEDDEEIIYFVEDDYLHKNGSRRILEEGFGVGAHYVTLYDHPDKYIDGKKGGNPYVEDGGEMTRVYLSDSSHWKLTNSTTMTFAAKVKTLKEDEAILRKWTNGTHPNDFQMFMDLRSQGRSLISPLPGYSTHGETKWLSPLTDWSKV